ncbi:MAG: hypothetical protein DRO73_08070 [Candidatus Thorarchaeota archaeon]|nr:MAG: hypothetical protein DRO73_08070 [Candidatus Thorarchaeota archaeon]
MEPEDLTSQQEPTRFAIENLGPVRHADIEIRPLSVFIGPNNAGKSYVSTIIHALGSAFGSGQLFMRLLMTDEPHETDEKTRIDRRLVRKLNDFVKSAVDELLHVKPPFEPNALTTIEQSLMLMEQQVSAEIEGSFACPPGKIVRYGTKRMLTTVDTARSRYVITVTRENEVNLKLVRLYDDAGPMEETPEHKPEMQDVIDYVKRIMIQYGIKEDTKKTIQRLHDIMVKTVVLSLFVPLNVTGLQYLPAARGGSTQTYRSLTAEYFHSIPFTLTRPQNRPPTLNRATAVLFAQMANLPETRGPLAEVVEPYEERTTGGHIEVSREMSGMLSRLEFKRDGHSIGLQRVSSSVSELAPFYLYLKYYVTPDSMLIVEEPEAHLHPENQILIARLLARLVNEDVTLLITTHSDFLLNQLSNCVTSWSLTPEERAKIGINEEETLNPEDVAVYLFEMGEDKYSTTRRLTIDDEGIPDQEFVRVSQELYEQMVYIDTAMSRYRHR